MAECIYKEYSVDHWECHLNPPEYCDKSKEWEFPTVDDDCNCKFKTIREREA